MEHLRVMTERLHPMASHLDVPIRSKTEALIDLLYESLEAVCAMAHEKEIVYYTRQQLERADELRRG
jgi:hypothetical protein